MAEAILIKFLLIIVILFFVPKVAFRLKKIPYPISEVALGIILATMIPSYFFVDDVIRTLAVLGVITIFVSAGMEIDTGFMVKNRRIIT
jgi:Kef-type K+ transport system membrane component KefB